MEYILDAVVLLRLGYLVASALVLLIFAIRPFRVRFLDYGARKDVPQTEKKTNSNIVTGLMDHAASLRVPHNWFVSFYAVSVTASMVWATVLTSKSLGFDALPFLTSHKTRSMTFRQVLLVWAMMFGQGNRRLYECLAVSKPSNSQMWFGHWLLGILFYLATNVAVWIEGIPSIKRHTISLTDFVFGAPDIRTFLGFLLFLLASGFQHDCHAYLASLKEPRKTDAGRSKPEYRLPDHPAFNISVTPHYFAECLIYFSMAIVAAPSGDWLNWTLVSALVFVAVNLGVTAHGTKAWYEQKFGPDSVKGKARMIPYVY